MAVEAAEHKAAAAGGSEGSTATKQWNTHNITGRLGADVTCAATAGGLVAPLIMTVDKCIIENASGKRTMTESIKSSLSQLAFRPHRFFTSNSFLIIFLVYGGTYTCANVLDTWKSTSKNRIASSTTSGWSKFAATSTANMGLSLYKDSQFTKMFGTVSARPIPPLSYALFMTRDALTIFASFNLPALFAPKIPIPDDFAEKYISRASTAQFMIPAAMQLVSTPLHLLGLDLYNEGDANMRERLKKIRMDYFKSSLARMARIIPAFGVGGVVNTGMRKRLMIPLEQ